MVPTVLILAAILAAGAAYQRLGTRRRRRQMAPPGTFIDVGGHRLHVHCLGVGSPVVLFESGIAASSVSWSLVQPRVASFARACAYDRAGLAWSDAASCPRTFEHIVIDLARVLAHIAPGHRYLLVGHSFGSFVIRAYAARYPANVIGLVLVDPPTEWLALTDQQLRMIRGARQLSRLGGVLAQVGVVRACLALLTGGAPGAPREFVRLFGSATARTLGRLVGEVSKLPPDVHPIVQELWCQPKCFRAMADYLAVLAREGASIGMATPPAALPTVVISSANQPPEQIARHQELAAQSKAGRHVVADRSTHWVQFDQPDLIVTEVESLLRNARS